MRAMGGPVASGVHPNDAAGRVAKHARGDLLRDGRLELWSQLASARAADLRREVMLAASTSGGALCAGASSTAMLQTQALQFAISGLPRSNNASASKDGAVTREDLVPCPSPAKIRRLMGAAQVKDSPNVQPPQPCSRSPSSQLVVAQNHEAISPLSSANASLAPTPEIIRAFT